MYIYLKNKKEKLQIYNIVNKDIDTNKNKSDENKSDSKSTKKEKKDFVIGFKETNNKIINAILNYDWCALVLSYAFIFTNYMIAVASNASYISSIMIFPLIMLGLDKLIYEKKHLMFIFTFAISIICNIHISIISLIFMFFYIISRKHDSFYNLFNSMIYYILSVIVSCLLSGIVIINSINGSFLKDDLSLKFPTISYDNPFDYFCQFLPRTSLSCYSLYGKTTDICIGAFFIFFIFVYLFNKKINIYSRIANILIFFIYFSGTYITFFKYFFNGFSILAGQHIHFGYILSFIVISIAYEHLMNIEYSTTKNVLIAGSLSTILLTSSMLISSLYESMNILLVSFELIFLYFILALIFSNKSMKKNLFMILISFTILFDVVPSFYTNLIQSGKGYLSQPLQKTYSYQAYECTRYIHNTQPEATIYNYTRSSDDLFPTEYSFAGYDYIISRLKLDSEKNLLEYYDSFQLEGSKNILFIYKNNCNTSGCIFEKNISKFSYNNQKPFFSTNILSTYYLKHDYIFTDSSCNLSFMETSDPTRLSFILGNLEHGNLYFKGYVITPIGEVTEDTDVTIEQQTPELNYPSSTKDISIVLFNYDNYSKMLNDIQTNKDNKKANLINGEKCTIHSDKDGYYSSGLTYTDNMNIYVNDHKVNAVPFIEKNTLIPVSTGENIIEIKYSPLYFIIGLVVSIISFIILLFYYLKMRNTDEEDNR